MKRAGLSFIALAALTSEEEKKEYIKEYLPGGTDDWLAITLTCKGRKSEVGFICPLPEAITLVKKRTKRASQD